MTGNDVLRQAYGLLNYTDANGNVNAGNNANLTKRSLLLINQIYADLWQPMSAGAKFAALTAMSQELELDDYTAINIMPYGVAMLLAQSDGDSDNQAMMAELYNRRRPGAATQTDRILDAMPRTYL